MNRQEISKLENHIQLLLKSYSALQEENSKLNQELIMCKSLLEQSQKEISKARDLNVDLKLQLDSAITPKANYGKQDEEISKIQAKVQKLITEVDGCIKSLE